MISFGFTRPRETVVLLERERPTPSPGQVLVRIESVGLGAADFGFFQLDALPRTPLIPGLEAVGVVEQSLSPTVAVGARVGLLPLVSTCGQCGLCERGLERWCAAAVLSGWHVDGHLQQFVSASPEQLVVCDDRATAPLFASGWTAFSAVRAAGLGVGHRLGVIGIGGVGHLVAQVARAQRLEVLAMDVDVTRAQLANGSPRALEAESVDAVVVCTPSTQAIQQAVRAVRRGGAVVLAAASPSVRFDVSLFELIMRGVRLVPVFLGSRSELAELLELHRSGAVEPVIHEISPGDVPMAFWKLRDGGFSGRLVVRFEQPSASNAR